VEQNGLRFRCKVVLSSGAGLVPGPGRIIVSCCKAACFAFSCQSSHSGSPDSHLLGILHLPVLIPNLVVVMEVCKHLVPLSKAQTSGITKLVFMKKKHIFSLYNYREKNGCTLKIQKLESKNFFS